MAGIQPDNQIVFERTRQKLALGPRVLVSKSWFRLCKTTITRIHQILSDNDEWEIEEDDLKDFSSSLRSVRNTLKEFKSSRFGPLYPFGKIISILNQAKRPLGGALGIKNVHAPLRTKYIQDFDTKLEDAISLMEGIETMHGFNDIPP